MSMIEKNEYQTDDQRNYSLGQFLYNNKTQAIEGKRSFYIRHYVNHAMTLIAGLLVIKYVVMLKH